MLKRITFWVMGLVLLQASLLPAANIIWVDEGASDGFTGWQELLEGAGHTVTQMSDMGALDNAKIDAMNESDLVIVSRDTNSGNYDDGDEIAQWNGLTVPLMQMSSYLIRSSRWLWVNDTGTPGVGAADNLLIVESHPIFRGVGIAGDEIAMLTGAANLTGTSDGGNGQVLATHTDGRLWITLWEAETEFYSGSGQTPAAQRLWFAGGEGIDSGLKGSLNLSDEGQTIFLNAVNFLTGAASAELASNPSPVSDSVDVVPASILAWDAGEYAAEHDIYLGTSLEDVNNATTDDAAYMGRQAATTYEPAALDLGETYFWRVDEVNSPPDSTVFKGAVWNFTMEPVSFAVPIGTVSAAATSTTDGQDPNNTVNGSGLNENDEHANKQEDMWLADTEDTTPSIQFEFSQLEKLDKVHVWNHNTQTESILGFGIKEALVEYSADGENWVEFGTITLGQATGSSDYTGEDVTLNGIVAKAVKMTGLSNYSILGLPQKGLSEVRFYALPMRARLEAPASGSAGLDPTVDLSWRAGRDAAQHEVLIGTDPDALTLVATVDEASYTAVVDLDSTVYWQVNEVNGDMDPAVWEGELWSLDTAEYVTVDDMEAYKSKDGFYVWETWIDGFGDDDNGALLGHNGDDMESDLFYDGKQSLPFYYGQGGSASSEAFRDIERDWGQHGIVSLSLIFYGSTSNIPGTMYIKVNDEKIATYPTNSDLTVPAWQAWTIDLPASALGNVKNLAIGFESGTGLVLIDAIRLYAKASETIDPVVPDDTGLVAFYPFEGNANDASGNGNNGTEEGGPQYVTGQVGQALDFDGVDDFVSTGKVASQLGIDGNKPRTVSVWVYTRGYANGGIFDVGARVATEDFCLRTLGDVVDQWRVQYWGGDSDFTYNTLERWVNFVHVHDGTHTRVYGDGRTLMNWEKTINTTDTNPFQIGLYGWPGNFFYGVIDELRVYDRALTQAEALGLAGRSEPIFKEF